MEDPSKINLELLKKISDLEKRIQELEQSARSTHAEKQPKVTGQQLQLLINAGPDFFFLKDSQLRYRLINSANARFFGRDESEIIGRTDAELMSEKAALACQVSDRQAIREKRMVITIEPVGDRIYETRKFPVIDCGRVVGVAGIIRDITEHKQAEQALAEELANKKAIFEHAPNGILIIDTETTRFLEFNSAAHNQLGYSRKEFGKLSIFDVEAKETADETRQRIAAVVKNGRDDFETMQVTKQGEIRNVHVTAQLISVQGRPVYYCVWRDITKRKKAEEALKDSEALLSSIFQASSAGISLLLERKIVKVNHSLSRITGYSEKELIGQTTRRLYISDEEFNQVGQTYKEMERDGLGRIEARLRRKDGSIIHVLICLSPVKPNDIKGGVISTILDITDLKTVETALKESEELYRTLVAASPDAITVTDLSGRITVASPKALELFAISSEDQVVGRHILEWVPDNEHREAIVQAIQELFTNGGTWSRELVLRKDDGALLEAEAHAAPLRAPDDTIWGGIFITRDVAERKSLQAQLLQSQKMEAIGTLAGGIAHDFNNILMTIMGYANLIETQLPAAHSAGNYVQQIHSCTSKAANITRSLLTFSRKQSIELAPQSTNTIIRDVEKLLQRIVPEDVELAFVLNEDVAVMADMTQIDQVLINLVSNAKDAMPKGGKILIQTKAVQLSQEFRQAHGFGEPGPYALISVSDTGFGMDEATQKKIFEPFFTTKEVGKGTGLGLSIVYGIIKQHGGYITVSSQPGRGSVFSIYLPAVKMLTSEPSQTLNDAPRGTETLLLAEDNPDLRKILKEILSESGYTVLEAENGQDAIDTFVNHCRAVELLILDVVMPGKNGKETYEEIRKIKPSIRVLFMSGYTGDVILNKGVHDAAVDFIAKPLSARDLLKKVREVLER